MVKVFNCDGCPASCYQNSTAQVRDQNSREAMRLGYSPFGQVYRKHNDRTFCKLNSGVNANNQLNALMPYQYTGRYTEAATGLVHLDARWYNPHTQRFVQPDLWNFRNTGLPVEIQHELMRFTGLDTNQLLRDSSQQMAYGYVSGNPLRWVDPLGLDGTVWTGDVTKVGAAYGLGASIYSYELESTNPYTGVLVKVNVIATYGEAGLGINMNGSTSEVVFTDDNLIPEPTVFEGTSMVAGISWAVVGGANYGTNILGDAKQDMSLSFALGWDASASVGIGSSKVLGVEYIRQYQCTAP